jgi:hypothetical protein
MLRAFEKFGKERLARFFCPPLEIAFIVANNEKLSLRDFKGLSQDEDWRILQNISVSLPLMKSVQPDPSRWTVPLNDDSYTDLLLLFSSLCKLTLAILYLLNILTWSIEKHGYKHTYTLHTRFRNSYNPSFF